MSVAADAIVTRGARLPLVLAIAAARAAGRRPPRRRQRSSALEILDDLGDPDAERPRAKLRQAGQPAV